MGVSAGTRTISDGLVLALDAANTRSYPGSGTTWFDLSDRGNNGTLTNGPSFVRPTFREPFGGAGSVYFDGSGDYLTATNNAAFGIGSGDFTVEGWVYFSSAGGVQAIISQFNANGTGPGWTIYKKTTDVLEFYGGTGTIIVTGTTALSAAAWNHFAVVRNGSTITIYVNGTAGGTGTNSSFTDESTAALEIGARASGSSIPFTGYISNLRVVKGTALYTSNFTPKRESFVTQSSPYTSLLTCQNGTIRDASPNNFTITRVGNVTPVSYAPYISFDGTNDYASLNASSDFNFGTGDFAVETWFYLTGNAAPNVDNNRDACIFNCGNFTNSNIIHALVVILGSSTTTGTGIQFFKNQGGIVNRSQTISISQNIWHHLVITRIGTNLYFFLDNLQVGATITDSNSWGNSTISSSIGALTLTSIYRDIFPGYISNFRIYKGKGLTATEVSQNYQNTKSRYGL